MAAEPGTPTQTVNVPADWAVDLLMQRSGNMLVDMVEGMDPEELGVVSDRIDDRISDLMEDPANNEYDLQKLAYRALIIENEISSIGGET